MPPIADNAERRASYGRVEKVPLAASKHEHEVLAMVEVALGDDAPRPETALDAFLALHLAGSSIVSCARNGSHRFQWYVMTQAASYKALVMHQVLTHCCRLEIAKGTLQKSCK